MAKDTIYPHFDLLKIESYGMYRILYEDLIAVLTSNGIEPLLIKAHSLWTTDSGIPLILQHYRQFMQFDENTIHKIFSDLTKIQHTVNEIKAQVIPNPVTPVSTPVAATQVPTITGVAPQSGPVTGGTVVTVTGLNFTGASGVLFGTVAGTNLVVNSETSITITSPAQPADTLDIRVVDGSGTSPLNTADKYTFA